MPLIPLQIPPGVYANGTDFEASNRWLDASLVRWSEGTMRPVGGWAERVEDAFSNPPRGMLGWQDNSGDRRIAAGTADKLYSISASGTVTDITPASLTAGDVDSAINTGYGGGFFGLEDFGVERQDAGSYSDAATWSLDNWGENLVACSSADGTIWEWGLDTADDAAAVSNAPTDNSGILVSEERFLFALGAGGNPRKVQWSDREDNTTWTAASTNEAGDIELQTSGQIMAGLRVQGQALILTSFDAHSAVYSGPPFVYGFERVGTACGLIARLAATSTDRGAFWMGARSFFFFDGASVQELACDVHDAIFGDLNTAQVSKCWAVSNAQFGEVWWFYPSSSSTEIDSYVVYDYKEGYWTLGKLDRTSGVDRGAFRTPIWANSSGNVYNHETGRSYDGAEVYAETGPISLGAGDQVMKVTELIPDEETQGDVTATFKTRFHPNDTERTYGPYTMSNPTSVRFTGRQIRMRVVGARLADWRVGVMRIDATPGGRR